MATGSSGAQKDDPKHEDPLPNLSNDETLSGKDSLLKLQDCPSQKSPQQTLVSDNGKWLQIVKNGHEGAIFRGARLVDSKIPRHVLSLDERYLRRCLELIHISALKSARCGLSVNFVGSANTGISSYRLDPSVTPKESTRDVPQVLFELPSACGTGNAVISPRIAGYKSIMRMLDKPMIRTLGALDNDPNSVGTGNDDVKGLVSRGVACSPSRYLMNLGAENTRKEVVSVSSTSSTCFSSELSSSSSSSTSGSRGTLRFTLNANGLPHFAFALDDQKERFVASLSNSESNFNRDAQEHTYLIRTRKGNGNESHLVGKMKVSTLFSVSSTSNSRIMEREFVLFSNCGNSQIQRHDTRKHRGLPRKFVDAFKNKRTSRQRSVSRSSRASSTSDLCPRDPFQEPDYDLEPVNLLDNDLPPNIESSAIVTREEIPEERPREEVLGGWGMKFLKKTSVARTSDASDTPKLSTSMVVIIPSGIHGGPRKGNDGGPSSLIRRWKSDGLCDCGGWDLGCRLTVLDGQPRKEQSEGQCNLFELFTEGSKHGTSGLKIVNVHEGLYFVQLQPKISALQSFSIAIAYIHSQSQRLRPSLAAKVCRSLS